MKTAYLILAHKNPAQLSKLIEALDTQTSFFFVHLDARTSIDDFPCLANHERIFCVERRAINWGGWSMVSATLDLMRKARTLHCERYHLLSGQDYPLKSNASLHDFFENDNIYLNHFPLPAASWHRGGMDRLQLYHFIDLFSQVRPFLRHVAQRVCRVIGTIKPRTMPYGLKPYGGSQWWSITGECVEFILDFMGSHPLIEPFFKKTLIPDELFFQTLIMNSHLRTKVINDNQRYVMWDALCPSTLKSEKIGELMNSNKCFARKFDEDADKMVFSAIDAAKQQA